MNHESLNSPAVDAAESLEIGMIAPLNRSGARNTLYLIPAEENGGTPCVCLSSDIGNGVPARAWHRRWLSLVNLPHDVVPESVMDAIEACRDEILHLDAAYQGTRWDGHNHVGVWDYGDLDQIEWDRANVGPIETSILDAIRTYYDPNEYYIGSVDHEVERLFYESWRDGMTLDDLVEQEIKEALTADVEMSSVAVEKCLQGIARMWLREHDDPSEDGESESRIRAILASW